MRRVISKKGQTLFDIAIQYMGTVEAIVDIILLNPMLRLDHVIAPDTELQIPDEATNKNVADYMSKNRIVPVSGGFNPNIVSVTEEVNISLNTEFNIEGPVWDLGYILGPFNIVFYFDKPQPVQELFTLNMYKSPDGLNGWTLVPKSEVVIFGGPKAFSPATVQFIEGRYFRFNLSNINVLDDSSITQLSYGYEKYC